MAYTAKTLALIVSVLGIISFILGVIAENKKPAGGELIPGDGVMICKYPSDPSIALGYLSFVFLLGASVVGYYSLFYPYKGKSVPQSIFFRSGYFITFLNIAIFTSGLGATLTLWPTIQEQLHLKNNVHPVSAIECPTAKTGLLGGGAFVSLDSTLFWIILLMISVNVREDFFLESQQVDDASTTQASSPIDIY